MHTTIVRRTCAKIILTFLVVAIGALAVPGEAAADYQMLGSGPQSCGAWTAARRFPNSTPALEAAAWVLGFLSGVGWVHKNGDDPLNGLDVEAVFGWLDNYCQTHPIDPLAVAAAQLAIEHPK